MTPAIDKKRTVKFAIALTSVFAVSGIASYFFWQDEGISYETVEDNGEIFIDWLFVSLALMFSPITMIYENISESVNYGKDIDFKSLGINFVFLFGATYPIYWYFKKGLNLLLAVSMFFMLAGGSYMLAAQG